MEFHKEDILPICRHNTGKSRPHQYSGKALDKESMLGRTWVSRRSSHRSATAATAA